MRTAVISALVLGSSACIYACGGSTTSLLSATGGSTSVVQGGAGGPSGGGGSHPVSTGGHTISYECPGPFSTSVYCGGTSGGTGFGGTSGFGGTTGIAPVSSGGLPADWNACPGAAPGAFNCGGASGSQNTGDTTGGATGLGGTGSHAGAGGSGSLPTDGGASSSSVLNLSLTWAASADAGALVHNVVVMPDGTATCSEYRNGWLLIGREGQPDPTIAALLAEPGTVEELATPCPLKIADAEPTITTTFVGDAKVDRLVWGTCSSNNLAALAANLRRIGDLCVATGTMIRDY